MTTTNAEPPEIPSPPEEPLRSECCGRGCDPCIFDYYADALATWKERVQAIGGDPAAELRARGRSP